MTSPVLLSRNNIYKKNLPDLFLFSVNYWFLFCILIISLFIERSQMLVFVGFFLSRLLCLHRDMSEMEIKIQQCEWEHQDDFRRCAHLQFCLESKKTDWGSRFTEQSKQILALALLYFNSFNVYILLYFLLLLLFSICLLTPDEDCLSKALVFNCCLCFVVEVSTFLQSCSTFMLSLIHISEPTRLA